MGANHHRSNNMTKIHALLVGINAYSAAPLRGCVNDTLAFGAFFQQLCRKNGYQWHPTYLLAPHPEDHQAIRHYGVSAFGQPTRNELIEGLEHLRITEMAAGDICVFYYSGHGSQEPAPEEFRHLKSDGMNETLVCMDSREPGGRDLVDKELAWLLWRISAEKPNVHFLVVMDCCHSGNNTRAADDSIRNRDVAARSVGTNFQHLLGIGDQPEHLRIFDLKNGRAEYRAEGRHVHLAAARDSETAKELIIEGQQRGAFTWSLLKTLEQGGISLNYREIMRRTEILVRNRVKDQIPQMDAREQALLRFLGQEMTPYKPEYPLVFRSGEWRIMAGQMHGITAGTASQNTEFQIVNEDRRIKATAVFAQYSVLDDTAFDFEDRDNIDLRGIVAQMPAPKINIKVQMQDSAPRRQLLEQELQKLKLEYANLDFNGLSEAYDYEANTDEQGNYMLLKPGSLSPVFLRQASPFNFLSFCDSVGKWRFVLELHNPDSQLRPEDLDIELEIIENQMIEPETLNHLAGRKQGMDQPVLLHYKNGNQPALRCQIKVKNRTLWVAGLYMDNQFGVHDYLTPRQLTPSDAAPHRFEYRFDRTSFNAIPLQIEEPLRARGTSEITEYLKIFISTQDISLSDLTQASLPLDDVETKRAGFAPRPAPVRPDWMVVTIPIKIKDESITTAQNFAQIIVPQGLKITSNWYSSAQVREKMAASALTRGETENLKKYLLPPASIWGQNEGSTQVFTRSIEMVEEAAPSMLEILEAEGTLTQPMILKLQEKAADNEVIIPYGYDPDNGIYIPLGFTNAEGDVEIHSLPPKTPGVLNGENTLNERSLKQSIKMFFRKLIRRKLENRLYWVRPDLSTIEDKAQITTQLDNPGDILLVTHGIFGNTEDKKAAVLQATNIHEQYCAVLAYDYENLDTDLRVTARDLFARLKSVGACDATKGARLVIIGPSMGGLVSRWMIEKEDAAPFVKHLLMVATPNIGSELSIFRKRLFGLLGRALNGSALFKPYLIPISFLAKQAEKSLWRTLNDLDPKKSDFLKELNINAVQPNNVRYSLLGGDVKGVTMQPKNEGSFWSRLKRFVLKGAAFLVVDWLVFDGPHDMAVEVESQKAVPWLDDSNTAVVPLDHLSYFIETEGLAELKRMLNMEQA